MLDPHRTIDELKALRALTGDEHGAQRVAFTDTWLAARAFLKERLDALPVTQHMDAAGNWWATLPGESDRALLIGGHLDSVPNGGWLDGCLNILAGLEVLRRVSEQYAGRPPVTLKLVDWADEEGARFGRSLYGSSAASGHLNLDEVRALRDRDGVSLEDALKRVGITLADAPKAQGELKDAAAYLELHIEQGPVLEGLDLPLGAVLGTVGVERHTITFHGQAAHSGSTPMNVRRDAFLAAGRFGQAIYDIAARHGGVCTIGSVKTLPGIVTSVVETCELTLDQRHLDADNLAAMWQDAQDAATQFAQDAGCTVTFGSLWNIEPIPFHPMLIDAAEASILTVTPTAHRLPSGPLHDAAEVARAGVPTVMLFVQSLRGISHNRIEDTREDYIALSVQALDELTSRTMDWIARST
ncbi:Zn-dependent hydrolase [Deinococcus soli (ex Cha et al. 2016)]|uniref:N-carbamoyl-L-amino-acid hydrolase n=2 Tax=Deinococcus soli (ex Cha et al. 2016) TaxID=1309411 RepID=A0ACC6KEM1_9DEIO|nr:Zn-dependent hydrolase [Deinococcus soli (ex Cha et al. 2016)]MDR6217770.1 N-carbamoyl-L-amino-acid hydrolase [Deinococcus soli (ex Cha et al. 2016)]MDR6328020.1 N-carbamoyl-L-amino-acid hydrolase [Deinococcus soli (ex Cha et al. 2016)]MDR6750872.1 N-carbamoyl-L-amino-acid hydrolase [Deinococcus soli (ex Cha et al. 2016)]